MRSIIYIILFYLLIGQNLYAQNQIHIDSLMQELLIAKDTARAQVLTNLTFEYHQHNPEKALEYGQKAIELSQKLKLDHYTARSLRYMGVAYRINRDFTRALKHFYLSMAVSEKIGNKLGVARCLNNMGEVYKYRDSYKEAIDKYKRAVEIFEELGVKEGTANALSNLADVYYRLAKYKSSLHFAMKSLAIAQSLGTNESIKEASLILSEAYARVGNYREAYHFQLLHTSVKDSVFSIEKSKEIQYMEEKFEKERKETAEKIRREKQAEQAMREKNRRNNIQYSLIFIGFIALFGSMFFIGKFDVPQKYVESLIFLTLLLLFRFILILLLPYTETYSEGAPLFTLFVNVILALLFMPLSKLLESRLKKKVIEDHIDDEKIKVSITPQFRKNLEKIKDKILKD